MLVSQQEDPTVMSPSEQNYITIKLSEMQQKLIWRLREQITQLETVEAIEKKAESM